MTITAFAAQTTARQFTPEQAVVLAQLLEFMDSKDDAFILSGAAGTGKTLLLRALSQALYKRGQHAVFTAPTGRSAHILSQRLEGLAATVHACLYHQPRLVPSLRLESGEEDLPLWTFALRANAEQTTALLVVDEASMVGNHQTGSHHLKYGTGRLLNDVLSYARGTSPATRMKLLFVGDPAQLPPVGEAFSPALDAEHLRTQFGLSVREASLRTVMRQGSGSSILAAASPLRRTILEGGLLKLDLSPRGSDLTHVNPSQTLRAYGDRLRAGRDEESILITRSNHQAAIWNQDLRRSKGCFTKSPVAGDRLILQAPNLLHGFANSSFLKVLSVDGPAVTHTVLGIPLVFRPVIVRGPGPNHAPVELRALMLENLLASDNRDLDRLQLQALWVHFLARHPGLTPKAESFFDTLRQDPYWNALRVKYAYALTCHKAQGSEWNEVHLALGYLRPHEDITHARWLYTALTRASQQLNILGWPSLQAAIRRTA